MSRTPREAIAAAALLTTLLLTACSNTYDKLEHTNGPAAVDPATACKALVAAPRGLAEQKAVEIGCIEIGDNEWEFQGDAASADVAPVDPEAVVEDQPGGGIPWDEAVNYAGTTQRVCGPLAGSGNSNDDVFLNLGRDYPDAERFQIVLWDIGGVEAIPYGSTLCTSGPVTLHEGVAQIELQSASSVEIYD
jgi:hypothetical protein